MADDQDEVTLDLDSHAGGTLREHEGRDELMRLQAQEPRIASHHRGGVGSDMVSLPASEETSSADI